ncbi:hypothetical protein LSAT2_003352 [Lamellibrachia satsuma]|nr:hypothetical protein LSAT2_003352 [Lamellibrachia satsuma]
MLRLICVKTTDAGMMDADDRGRQYFSGAGGDAVKTWWRGKLADYFGSFETTNANVERKVEEYPFHLIAVNGRDRLEEFLVEWLVFFEVPDNNKLMQFWLKGSDLTRLKECYLASINDLANSPSTTKNRLSAAQLLVADLL